MFNIITGGTISMLESKVKQINASSRLLENKHPRNYMNNQIEN